MYHKLQGFCFGNNNKTGSLLATGLDNKFCEFVILFNCQFSG